MSVLESVPRDFVVTRLNCSDNDAGLNAELSYFITGEGGQGVHVSAGTAAVVGVEGECSRKKPLHR